MLLDVEMENRSIVVHTLLVLNPLCDGGYRFQEGKGREKNQQTGRCPMGCAEEEEEGDFDSIRISVALQQ